MPGFFGRANDIRSLFEERVGPSREGSESRFVWSGVELVVHNLVSTGPEPSDPATLLARAEERVRETRFPPSEGRSVVVLPLG